MVKNTQNQPRTPKTKQEHQKPCAQPPPCLQQQSANKQQSAVKNKPANKRQPPDTNANTLQRLSFPPLTHP